MPRGDGTGPVGMGPMTGRSAGYCNGYSMPGFANCGRTALGRGMGSGRGFRRMFYHTGIPGRVGGDYVQPIWNDQPYNEKSALKKREEFLEMQLKDIKDRLKDFTD